MQKNSFKISKIASTILKVGLPIMALYFVYIIVSVLSVKNTTPNVIANTYSSQLEHIFMSFTILIVGAVIMDITEKELK